MRYPTVGVVVCFARIGEHLKCCDLREIQNSRDGDNVRRNVNGRMVVDAEVAHRMSQEQPRQDYQFQQERNAESGFHSTGTTTEERELD